MTIENQYARELLSSVDEPEPAALPSLVALEMLVLGAGRQVLFDEPAVRGWNALPEGARSEFADDVIANLTQRGLLHPNDPMPTQSRQLRIHPALAVILTARTFPTWVAVCSDQHSGRSDLRMFGLGDTDDAFLGAVVEVREEAEPGEKQPPDNLRALTATYTYRLVSTLAASKMLADWVVSPDAPVSARQIELLHHREGEQMRSRRIEPAQSPASSDADARVEWFHQAIRDSLAA